ncbi:MAG: ATP-binding cassette domain-containing protein [Victivallales bacterium]|nr:ATP-binding cassette domain-containing protein [Victivallales bacterium]MCF7888589.1 ATP-binding cassette domain-containing protein [Victivallales bacterium]
MSPKVKLIEIKNLKKYFYLSGKNTLKAVDGVTFDIFRKETFGLVGESGCGKTTLGRTVSLLYSITDGGISFKGKDIAKFKTRDLAKKIQIIFQDPDASLNPRMTAGDIIAEGLDIFKLYKGKKERQLKIFSLLENVGLNKEHANRFPHEFSGGQKQRIGIARALAVEPEFIICDEPISALDVSIQAQIVNLLKRLQNKYDLTFLFIAHDLSMVKYISDRVGVMYLGNIVELTDSNRLYSKALHPYTEALLSAIPKIENLKIGKPEPIKLKGELPNPINPPKGCKFSTRCSYVREYCRTIPPELEEISPGHYIACHFVREIAEHRGIKL